MIRKHFETGVGVLPGLYLLCSFENIRGEISFLFCSCVVNSVALGFLRKVWLTFEGDYIFSISRRRVTACRSCVIACGRSVTACRSGVSTYRRVILNSVYYSGPHPCVRTFPIGPQAPVNSVSINSC